MRRMRSSAVALAAGAVLCGLLATGISAASSTSSTSSTSFYACKAVSGSISHVTTSASLKCTKPATRVSWSSAGPEGLRGLTGLMGSPGPQGPKELLVRAGAWVRQGLSGQRIRRGNWPSRQHSALRGARVSQGRNGSRRSSSGSGARGIASFGDVGSYYLDTLNHVLYGPAVSQFGCPRAPGRGGRRAARRTDRTPGQHHPQWRRRADARKGRPGTSTSTRRSDELYGRPATQCLPLPCHSIWGSGNSLIGAQGEQGTGPGRGLRLLRGDGTGRGKT